MDAVKLYKISKNGSVESWSISVSENEITTVWGKLDGKQQTKIDIIENGKNIGKLNETTPSEQAEKEALSTINLKLDKGYRNSIEEAQEAKTTLVKAMLVQDYTVGKNKDKIKFPCIAQPKLDGIRVSFKSSDEFENGVTTISRGGKEFPINSRLWYLTSKLMKDLNFDYLDGELYIHNELFEDVVSCVKKPVGNKLEHTIGFTVFDFPTVKVEDRDCKLAEFQTYLHNNNVDSRIEYVEQVIVNSEEEARAYKDSAIERGYEGIMLKNINYEYESGVRVYSVQKWKDVITEEYKIVDVIADKDGNGLFVCVLPDDVTQFEVNPKRNHAEKKEILANKQDYIGKPLTVKYQNLTSGGKPRFPVGLAVRDYE